LHVPSSDGRQRRRHQRNFNARLLFSISLPQDYLLFLSNRQQNSKVSAQMR
jgi:hypothetical protein